MGGTTGLNVTAAANVRLEDCSISNLQNGIVDNSRGWLYVKRTLIRANSVSGITLSPPAATPSDMASLLFANVENSEIQGSGYAGTGILMGDDTGLTMRDSTITQHAVGLSASSQYQWGTGIYAERNIISGNALGNIVVSSTALAAPGVSAMLVANVINDTGNDNIGNNMPSISATGSTAYVALDNNTITGASGYGVSINNSAMVVSAGNNRMGGNGNGTQNFQGSLTNTQFKY
jgi:hypothetical protein